MEQVHISQFALGMLIYHVLSSIQYEAEDDAFYVISN